MVDVLLVISIVINIVLAIWCAMMYKNLKHVENLDQEKLISMGQALAYRDILNSMNKMLGDDKK